MGEIANDCVPLQPFSFSDHSKIVESLKDQFMFDREDVTNESVILPAEANVDVPALFVRLAMASLKSNNEIQLQTSIFQAMRSLDNVTILDESIKKIPAISSRLLGFLAGLNAPTAEKAIDTKGLLQLYAEKYFPKNLVSEKAKLKMADAEPGSVYQSKFLAGLGCTNYHGKRRGEPGH
eukprot:scaffold12979_cov38-Attheya_sp.AAC.2